jgi:hypothetical protein
LQTSDDVQLAETLSGELVDLVAVVIDLIRDQQRLQPRRVSDRLEHLAEVFFVLGSALGPACTIGLLQNKLGT